MNKFIFSLLLLAIWSLMTNSQPTTAPPSSGSGGAVTPSTTDNVKGIPDAPENQQQQSLVIEEASVSEDWYCDIEFWVNGKTYYTESFDSSDLYAYRGTFARRVDNKISEVYWSGTRCYCWVVLYQDKYWQGYNWGFWTSSDSSSESSGKQLWEYITYNWDDEAWETWDTVVSSYSVYCY